MIDTANQQSLAPNLEKVSVWRVRPYQIVSLCEMLRFYAPSFYHMTRRLHWLQQKTQRAIDERGSNSPLTPLEAEAVRKVQDDLFRECKRVQLNEVMRRLGRINSENLQPVTGIPFTLDQLRVELEVIDEEIVRGLRENLFLVISTNKREYYDHSALFGEAVKERFPSAANDISEAGNCYATGRHTACVFHCMRALEPGLHALAQQLKVKFPRNPKTTIEFKTWGEIIRAITDAINAKPNPKSRKDAADSQFYNAAAAQFQFFKDAWRDVVMHSRSSPYDEHQAMSVLVHVREFMQHLATRLSESKHSLKSAK